MAWWRCIVPTERRRSLVGSKAYLVDDPQEIVDAHEVTELNGRVKMMYSRQPEFWTTVVAEKRGTNGSDRRADDDGDLFGIPPGIIYPTWS